MAESFICVARTAIKNQPRSLIESPQTSSQGLPRGFDMGDEDVGEPLEENVTRDEAICGRVHGEFSGLYPDSKMREFNVLFLVMMAGFTLVPSSPTQPRRVHLLIVLGMPTSIPSSRSITLGTNTLTRFLSAYLSAPISSMLKMRAG